MNTRRSNTRSHVQCHIQSKAVHPSLGKRLCIPESCAYILCARNVVDASHAREGKIGEVGPVAQLGGVAADANIGSIGGSGAIEDEELEPACRADLVVWWRSDGAGVAGAGKGREEGSLTHAVAVRAADRAHEGDFHASSAALVQGDGDGDLLAVCPIGIGDCVRWRGQAGHSVGGNEYLNPILFWVDTVLGIRSGDHDSSIGHENGFGVVQTSDCGIGHDGHAGVHWCGRVVEDSVQIRAVCKTETSNTMVSSVEDEVCAVRERSDAWHHTLRGHPLEDPSRVCPFWLNRNAVIVRSGRTNGRTTTDHDCKRCCVGCGHGHDYCRAFKRIVASGCGIVDVTRHLRQCRDCVEVDWFDDICQIVVSDENVSRL